MMRKAPSAYMQKTYDECYLICSTAIYFEQQNNEPEALRAWRNALDQIYYHNAYKMPSTWTPRSETEKALHDSLKAMELQCKERVDLLEALRKSRLDVEEEAAGATKESASKSKESLAPATSQSSNVSQPATWLGQDTIPQASYADIPRPTPPPERRPAQPKRPSFVSKPSSDNDAPRTMSIPSGSRLTPPSGAAENARARTPSPEKKTGGMLKTLRSAPKNGSANKLVTNFRTRPPPAAARAASQVWSGQPRPAAQTQASSLSAAAAGSSMANSTTTSWDPFTRSMVERGGPRDSVMQQTDSRRASDNSFIRPPSPSDYQPQTSTGSTEEHYRSRAYPPPYPEYPVLNPYTQKDFSHSDESVETAKPMPPPPPPHRTQATLPTEKARIQQQTLSPLGTSSISYMKEYPNHPPNPKLPPAIPAKPADRTLESDGPSRAGINQSAQTKSPPTIPRKAIGRAAGVLSATVERQRLDNVQAQVNGRLKSDSQSSGSNILSSPDVNAHKTAKRKVESRPVPARAMTPSTTDESLDSDEAYQTPSEKQEWDLRVQRLMKKLPKGVDEAAAKQIFNEVVIQGDEVHWDDVAGLEIAKSALKETVVYPFLRPDLFMGLREPARGMLLFGPPGTGKTMLARAVATESKSVFFAISASSLTSKFLGESEKLVRALFVLAKELAPSIIFVDEIDSLLGARGGGSEHEATRRIKTEFLIQWSDLQKAAAGREVTEGDASRVLVLAATNLPWAIDEAARRRFVRRQYIPLPEDHVREKQLRTLLAAQKHSMKDRDLKVLVKLTDGYSGSDITALAKDAAMGPLRSLGEKLLHMSPEDIRPIGMRDFEASLVNIRPSVSKQGLKEFEDWAREYGERGG